MVDIHAHIIFDVDDGPENETESFALLKESYKQGVRKIIATSHRRKGMFDISEEKYNKNLIAVKDMAKQVASDLEILPGSEIYYTTDIISKLEKGELPRLNNTGYVLVEFNRNTTYNELYVALSRLLHSGVIPVLAHIEYYDCLEKNEKGLKQIISLGCYAQVSSINVLKPRLFGDKHRKLRKRVGYFLDKNLVHFVASDMHNMHNRRPYMKEAYDFVNNKYGKERAERLFLKNQELLLADELIFS